MFISLCYASHLCLDFSPGGFPCWLQEFHLRVYLPPAIFTDLLFTFGFSAFNQLILNCFLSPESFSPTSTEPERAGSLIYRIKPCSVSTLLSLPPFRERFFLICFLLWCLKVDSVPSHITNHFCSTSNVVSSLCFCLFVTSWGANRSWETWLSMIFGH